MFLLLVACLYGLPTFADQSDNEGKQDTVWIDGVKWTFTITKKDDHNQYYYCTLNAVDKAPEHLVVPNVIQSGDITYKVSRMSEGCFNGCPSVVIDFSHCEYMRDFANHNTCVSCPNLEEIILPSAINVPTFVDGYTSVGIGTGYFFAGPKFKGFSIGTQGNGLDNDESAIMTNNTPGNTMTVGVYSGMLFTLKDDGAYFFTLPRGKLDQDIPSDTANVKWWNATDSAFTFPATVTISGTEYPVVAQDAYSLSNSIGVKRITYGKNMVYGLPGVEDKVEWLDVDPANLKYTSIDGVVFSKDETTLCIYPPKKAIQDSTYVVPASVTNIEGSAFHDVETLAHLDLSKCKVETLHNGMVYKCHNLKELICSRYIKLIESNITYNTGIERFVLVEPEGDNSGKTVRYWTGSNPADGSTYGILFTANLANPTEMGDTLVQYPHSNKQLEFEIPSGIRIVANSASEYCKIYHKLIIPASVEEIGNSAFSQSGTWATLDEVEFKGTSQLKKIGNGAFSTSKFENFTLPAGVTSIGAGAFAHNASLKTFTIPQGSQLETLGSDVFAYCTNMEELDMTNCTLLKNIPAHAFRLTQIGTLTFPAGLERIEDFAFSSDDYIYANDASMTLIFSGTGLQEIGQKAFKGCKNITSIDLSKQNELTHIGDYAFMESGIRKAEIPASVTSMGHHAFMACPQLQSIDVAGDNDVYISVKGVLYSKKTEDGEVKLKKLLAYPGGRSSDNYDFQTAADGGKNCYTIIPGVEEIGDSAFYGCEKLEDLKLPSSVKKIGNWAFRGCSRLTNVSIMSKQAPELNWTTPLEGEQEGTIDLYKTSESKLENGVKPVLIVRKGAKYNTAAWGAFEIIESFDDPSTHAEYFLWSESREAASNGAKQNTMAMEGEASHAKAGQFDLDDKKANAETFGFSKTVNYTDNTGRPASITWYYDKVAAMGIQDEAERKLAKTFIIPAKVQGNFDGTNRNYQVTAVGDSAFCTENAPFLEAVTMQGDPEYLAANSFNAHHVFAYFPNHKGVTKPLSSLSFKANDEDYQNGYEFGHESVVFLRKSAFENHSQLRKAADTDNNHYVWTRYQIPVSVYKVKGQNYYAGTISREFDVDFSDCGNNLLLFWVMKNFNRKPTEQIEGVDHYWNAWSFPSDQKYQLKAGDGAIVRVATTSNPGSGLYCTFYEGETALKSISEFNNPENSSEEGVIVGGKAPNALVGVYARTYLKNGDANNENAARAYTPFKVNCDGTPSGKTADVNSGYVMGWGKNEGEFILAKAKAADANSPAGQFTPFRAFLATEYQTLPTVTDPTNGSKVVAPFLMAWDGDASTVTDIRGIVNVVDGDNYYNINGQRVETPTAKGLYIHNGKKVLVK